MAHRATIGGTMYTASGRDAHASSDAPPMLDGLEAQSDAVIAEENVAVLGKTDIRPAALVNDAY